jgi:DNA-3-methyladenine glycosylase II
MSLHLILTPTPPFRLDLTVWTLRRRAENAIDCWDGKTYSRVLPVHGIYVPVHLTQSGDAASPQLRVIAELPLSNPELKRSIRSTLTAMLGLNVDLRNFYRMARRDRKLNSLVKPFVGMRPPRFPTLFEALASAVACQQLSLAVGIQLLNRLAQQASSEAAHGVAPFAFPTSTAVGSMSPDELRACGWSAAKARTIVSLAQAMNNGQLENVELQGLSDEALSDRLQSHRGIGRWTAEYVMLRGFGRTHVFPADDVGARHNLESWLQLPRPLDYAATRTLMRRWEGFGGLVYFHLLLRNLQLAGHI